MDFSLEEKLANKKKIQITTGNIFLSKLQTLTVTVNCYGIMGKGLALQAKNLFPEMFDFYSDMCKKKKMQIGKPLIYDKNVNSLMSSDKQFKSILLFPTKIHWKMKSEIPQIEKGLEWLEKNYKKYNIESLAMPALGCSNGCLDWKDVGPIIYRHVYNMDIPAEIYLPSQKTPTKYLTEEFLLSEPKKITDY